MLVDVPITVIIPPRTAANDSGMRKWETWRSVRCAHRETAGTSIATIGVLLRNADAPADETRRRASARRRPPPVPATRSTSGAMRPVRSTAAAITYRAPTVIGAGLLKPENASEGSRTPATSRTTTAPNTAQDGISLADLDPGRVAVILDVDCRSAEGQRLLDLGFVPHTEVRVLTRAPLGDPMVYSLRGTRLCLRRTEADRVRVRPL